MSQRRIFRRFVLPIAWLLIGAVIAISLVNIAFNGNATANEDQLYPTGEIPAETIMVETATVKNNLTLAGSIKLDEAQTLNAPVDGVVNWAFVKPGDNVSKGDRIFQIRAETTPESTPKDTSANTDQDASDEQQSQQSSAPVVTYHDVLSPSAGKVGKFAIELSAEVAKGDELAKIQPQNFKAVAAINPLDRYRLMEGTLEAEITIESGPEPFDCKNLSVEDTATQSITAESSTQEFDPGLTDVEGQGANETSGNEISCDVPDDVVVFDGLVMNMAVDAGSAEDVLTVPVTSVRGQVGQGTVWVLNDEGKEIRTEVELGVTDGKIIEVRSGLKADTEVLRYVPGSNPVPEEEPGMEYYP